MNRNFVVVTIAVIALIAIAVIWVNSQKETENFLGMNPQPMDSGIISATIISYEAEPFQNYAYPTFRVKMRVNKIINYSRSQEAIYPPLNDGEELNILLSFGPKFNQEVTGCENRIITNQTIIDNNTAHAGTGIVCSYSVGPTPTIEESVNYLSKNVGKTIVISVRNPQNPPPHEWTGSINYL